MQSGHFDSLPAVQVAGSTSLIGSSSKDDALQLWKDAATSDTAADQVHGSAGITEESESEGTSTPSTLSTPSATNTSSAESTIASTATTLDAEGVLPQLKPAAEIDVVAGRAGLMQCADVQVVANALRELAKYNGIVPRVKLRSNESAICKDGRGGGFCCKSNTIYLCPEREWVSCDTLGYELSHAVENASGRVECKANGMCFEPGGEDCGYFDADDLVCVELRAASLTGRCAAYALHSEGYKDCLKYHAKWALNACFPASNSDTVLERNWHRCYTRAIDHTE